MAKICRRKRRLFFCLLISVVAPAVGARAASPATTLISDTVYRADGSPATGTLIISWPTFSTAAGEAVTAGSMTVPIGTNGHVSVALAPNVGATPSSAYYRVIVKTETTSVEYWNVPAVATTTIAAIRSTIVPT